MSESRPPGVPSSPDAASPPGRLRDTCAEAKASLAAGDTAGALVLAQHMLRYYPHYLAAHLVLGQAHVESGRPADAFRCFTFVLDADPQNVLAHIGRGIIAEDQEQTDVAVDEYERAFEIDPGIPELRGELLRLYTVRYGSAGATVRTTPGGLAYGHLRAGRHEAAVNELRYLTVQRPDRWDLAVALAEALWRDEQLDDATALAEAILAAHPACVKCHWLLGYRRWTTGDAEAGRGHLLAALAFDPTYAIAGRLWDATPWALDASVTRPAEAWLPAPGAPASTARRSSLIATPPVTQDLRATATLPAVVPHVPPAPTELSSAGRPARFDEGAGGASRSPAGPAASARRSTTPLDTTLGAAPVPDTSVPPPDPRGAGAAPDLPPDLSLLPDDDLIEWLAAAPLSAPRLDDGSLAPDPQETVDQSFLPDSAEHRTLPVDDSRSAGAGGAGPATTSPGSATGQAEIALQDAVREVETFSDDELLDWLAGTKPVPQEDNSPAVGYNQSDAAENRSPVAAAGTEATPAGEPRPVC